MNKTAVDEVDDIDLLEDDDDLSEEEEARAVSGEVKNKHFEFTDSYDMMRIIRMLLFIQVIALAAEDPVLNLPPFFRFFLGDIIYVLQYFGVIIINAIAILLYKVHWVINTNIPFMRSLREVPNDSRMLKEDTTEFEVHFLNDQYWHSVNYISRFFFAIFFGIFVVVVMFGFWEIRDYTDTFAVQKWLKRFVSNGWLRRGGLWLLLCILSVAGITTMLGLFIYGVSHNFRIVVPPPAVVAGTLAIILCGVVVVWYLIYLGFRASESAFDRFVSQNVHYTASVILKRVVKTKTELAILVFFILYIPLVTVFMESLILVTDWNDTEAADHRRSVNFYTNCYPLAFPPYRNTFLPVSQCPVADLALSSWRSSNPSHYGYYKDKTLIQCDSLLGISLYVTGFCCLCGFMGGYTMILYRLISQGKAEFQGSRWSESYRILIERTAIEEDKIKSTFLTINRYRMMLYREFLYQTDQWARASVYFLVELKGYLLFVFELISLPLYIFTAPILFFGRPIAMLMCNFLTEEARAERNKERRRKIRQAELEKRKQEKLGLVTNTHRLFDSLRGLSSKSFRDSIKFGSFQYFRSKKIGNSSVSSPQSQPSPPPNPANAHVHVISLESPELNRDTNRESRLGDVGTANQFLVDRADENVDLDEVDDGNELMELSSVYDLLYSSFIYLITCCGGLIFLWQKFSGACEYLAVMISRSDRYVHARMKMHNLLEFVRGHNSREIVGLGQSENVQGNWRKDLTFKSRERVLVGLKNRVIHELHKLKVEHITDHQLIISFFDFTHDASGSFLLICPFRWNRLMFTFVIWTEITFYGLFLPICGYLMTWKTKIFTIAACNMFLIVFTYLAKPFSLNADRWIDFLGRVMVVVVCLGLFICESIFQASGIQGDESSSKLYAPWSGFSFISQINPLTAGEFVIVDLIMVAFVYMFVLTLLHEVGLYSHFRRMIKLIIYTFHDHILDFLVTKMDECTYGYENTNTGLLLIQQWDDIIRQQRRFALLTFPDVRPQKLTSFSSKVLEIKWASLFNLSLGNLRNSLGLNLLHVAMCSASGEACRWLITHYPEMMMDEDNQRDIPLAVGLKECAYCLIRYSKMNNGKLDDGSTFEDEGYDMYYPEVPLIQSQLEAHGEFCYADADVYVLSASEILHLKENGWFVETIVDEVIVKPQNTKWKLTGGSVAEPSGSDVLEGESSLFKKSITFGMQSRSTRPKGGLRGRQRLLAHSLVADDNVFNSDIMNAHIKPSKLFAKELFVERFVEDVMDNNFECGQMPSWSILDLRVPDVNLFVDGRLNDAKFLENEDILDRDMQYVVKSDGFGKDIEVGYLGQVRGVISTVPKNEAVPFSDDRFPYMSDWFDETQDRVARMSVVRYGLWWSYQQYLRADQYIRNFYRYVRGTPQDLYVPPSNNSFNMNRDELDDSVHKSSLTASSISKDYTYIQDDIETGPMSLALISELSKKHRMYRYKICRFADILLSFEVQEKCQSVKWDINGYKALSAMASQLQGRLAYCLASSFNLNPPDGFARFSDWSLGVTDELYEDGFNRSKLGLVMNMVGYVGETTVALADFFKSLSRGGGSYSKVSTSSFNDRIVQYLAETYVCSRDRCVLTDCELGGPGRIAYRAICRALRRLSCSFVLPSVFVSPLSVVVRYIELQKNELDCGHMVLLAEALHTQQELVFLDLSYNRIGCRGMKALCRVLREHKSLSTLIVNHNRIGPSAGLDLGLFLKASKSIKVLSLANNRVGPMIRYPTPYTKEKIKSGIRDIFIGLRSNKTLQQLDLSYNHFGPEYVEVIGPSILKHPCLNYLDVSGNDIGPQKGRVLMMVLAGLPKGDELLRRRDILLKKAAEGQAKGLSIKEALADFFPKDFTESVEITSETPSRVKQKAAKKRKKKVVAENADILENNDEDEDKNKSVTATCKPCSLGFLGIADNQLDAVAAYGVASFIKRNKSLTALDISGNSLMPAGGLIIGETLEKLLRLVPRDNAKKIAAEIQDKIEMGRGGNKKVLYTSLCWLNMARNGLGPTVCESLMYCASAPSSTLIHLDLSNNPLGFSSINVGDAKNAAKDVRRGLGQSKTLISVDLSTTLFEHTHIVTFLGGVSANKILQKLCLRDLTLDEPDCVQLANAIGLCDSLEHIDLANSKMGAKGAKLILLQMYKIRKRLKVIDITKGFISPPNGAVMATIVADPESALTTLRIGYNDLRKEGGLALARAIALNIKLLEVDLSGNELELESAVAISLLGRGVFKDGKLLGMSPIRTLLLDDNPTIGHRGSRILIEGLMTAQIEKLCMRKVGGGPRMALALSKALRHVTTSWRYIDVSDNAFGRESVNQICWGMRVNRQVRVLKMQNCQVGSVFCSQADSVGVHGIALPRVIRENVILRELDLSTLAIHSEGAINILEAMMNNYTIRKLSLRGNLIDDDAATCIGDFLRTNRIVEDLDLGDNQLGFNTCFAIADALSKNHDMLYLKLDGNKLGGAGGATIEAFCHGINLNTRLRLLSLDRNRLGPDWGCSMAESLCRNNTLNKVSLLSNRFDIRAGECLYRAYKHNTFLSELALSVDEVGAVIFNQIQTIYRSRKAVLSISDIDKETSIEHELSKVLNEYY